MSDTVTKAVALMVVMFIVSVLILSHVRLEQMRVDRLSKIIVTDEICGNQKPINKVWNQKNLDGEHEAVILCNEDVTIVVNIPQSKELVIKRFVNSGDL